MRGAHVAMEQVRGGAQRRWPRRVLIAANMVVFATLTVSAGAYGYLRYELDRIGRVPVSGLSTEGHGSQSQPQGSSIPPFTLLAIGSDTRGFQGGSQFQATTGTTTSGQRSDSIILIRVIPSKKQLALLSIPRDTLEEVPGYGQTRINAAFDAGTPSLLVQVLRQDFDIEVNHVAIVNFAAFEQISEAVGGVKVWFPAPARDLKSDLVEPAGCQTLIGPSALSFVRSRDYQYQLDGSWHLQNYPESDLGRIQRQQAFIKLALQKAKQVAPTNVPEITRLISSVTSNLTLDSRFSTSELLHLAQIFRSANLGNIPQFTYPTANSTSVYGALDPLVTQGQQVIQQWLSGGHPPASRMTAPTPASPTRTTVVAPASLNIEVANGSGTGGQAARAAADLIKLGYQSTLNPTGYSPSQSSNLILYAPDSFLAAKQLQAQLVGGATLEEQTSLTPTRYNLELVTGAKYSGVTGNLGGASTTVPTTATTTSLPAPIAGASTVEPDSSSYVNGQYIPPGRVPSQKVMTCP